MEQTIVLPKRIFKEDAVLIPRREYEKFLRWREYLRDIPVVEMTRSEKKALEKGREELKRGEYLNWEEVKNELENNHH